MTSASTVVITGQTPGTMTFTQEIDWPTGIQNPNQQYQKYILKFIVTVKPCPSPSSRVRLPNPTVSEGPGTPPSEAPGGPPAPGPNPPAGGGMETINAKPHNITICVGETRQIPEPEPMQGLLPDAEYGPLTPQNSSVASASIHNTMSSASTVFITGLSPGMVTFTQEVLWPTGVQNPHQQYVKIIVTFNVTVKACPSPGHRTSRIPGGVVNVKPTDPPANSDPQYKPAAPQPGDGTGTESGWYVPPAAGPTSEIVVTVADQNQPGPKGFVVLATANDGKKSFWQGVTDAFGRAHLRAPEVAGGLAALTFFRFFDKHAQADSGGTCHIGSPNAHLPDTQPLPQPPTGNPAITEAASSYERGGFSNGDFQLHVRGVDPLDTRVLVDGSPAHVDTNAVSDQSIVGHLHDDVALGRHTISLQSDGVESNRFPADIAELKIDPVPPSKIGEVQTVTSHVIGLPESDNAVAEFDIGGAVVFANGSTHMEVPVKNGIAQIQIRRIGPGNTTLREHIKVAIAGFWSL